MIYDIKDIDATLTWIVNTKCNISCPFCSNHKFHWANTFSNEIVRNFADPAFTLKKISKVPQLGLGGLKVLIEERLRNKFFPKSPERIRIKELVRTLGQTGKRFLIVFTGGEPFLVSNLIEACQELAGRHKFIFVTNLTTANIEEFCKKIPVKSVSCMYVSAHLPPINQKNLNSKYLENLRLCRDKGYKIVVNEVAYPPYIKDINLYKNLFVSEKIDFEFVPFKGVYKNNSYPDAYTQEEIKTFGLCKVDLDGSLRKGTLCSAGHNSMVVNTDGVVKTCFDIEKIHGNIYSEIKFNKAPQLCPSKVCRCYIGRE